MPRWSEERTELIRQKIRNILILKNGKVRREFIAVKLGISVQKASSMLKEIMHEDTDYENASIKKRVAHTERKLNSYDSKLFEMVFTKKGANIPWKFRISAIKQLRMNEKLRWNVLFDSGMFRRELGNQNITDTEEATLEQYLNYLLKNAPDDEFSAKLIELTSRFVQGEDTETKTTRDTVEKQPK